MVPPMRWRPETLITMSPVLYCRRMRDSRRSSIGGLKQTWRAGEEEVALDTSRLTLEGVAKHEYFTPAQQPENHNSKARQKNER